MPDIKRINFNISRVRSQNETTKITKKFNEIFLYKICIEMITPTHNTTFNVYKTN